MPSFYFIVLSAVASGQSISAPEIAAAAAKAVVSIKTLDARGIPVRSGTGWIVESSGIIVTNYHVITGGTSLTVTLESGETFNRVNVVSMDQSRDLAVLQITAGRLSFLRLGNDDAVRVGDKV